MLRITLLLVGLLAALSGFAQRLTGTVTTTNNQPIPFATVAVLNSTLGATADQQGHFSIDHVPAGRQTVAVSSVGYATRTQTVELATGQTVALTFQLPASTAGLGEVVVTAQKEETNLQKTPWPCRLSAPSSCASTGYGILKTLRRWPQTYS